MKLKTLQNELFSEYSVKNGIKSSEKFSFKTFGLPGSTWMPKIVVYGDLGVQNGKSVNKLIEGAKSRDFDVIWHIGDIAYDMYEMAGARGDAFMNMMLPVAANVPYSVIPGNHEMSRNFSEYSGRFTSPEPSVFYHSYNVGPIHVVMYTTEFYVYDQYGTGQLQVRKFLSKIIGCGSYKKRGFLKFPKQNFFRKSR